MLHSGKIGRRVGHAATIAVLPQREVHLGRIPEWLVTRLRLAGIKDVHFPRVIRSQSNAWHYLANAPHHHFFDHFGTSTMTRKDPRTRGGHLIEVETLV